MLGRKHGYSESKVREMINHVFDFALRPPGTPNPLPSDPPSYALVQATLRANEALQNRTGVNIRRSFTPITPRQSLLTQVSEFLERFVRIGSTAISGIVPDPNESLG